MTFSAKKLLTYFPFISDARQYTFAKLRADVVAALTVAIIALPQSMAYAIIAGVHPRYGLYAAIVPVLIAALLGSSRFLIAGPTNAVSMIVASSVVSITAGIGSQGLTEPDKMVIIFTLALLVGVVQLILGLIKFGNLMNFVSHSVIIGFTAGAGVLIAFNQLKNLLGVTVSSNLDFVHTVEQTFLSLPHTHWPSLVIGLYTIVLIIFLKKVSTKIPAALIAMVSAGLIVGILHLENFGVKVVGDIPRSLPPLSMPTFDLEDWTKMFGGVMAVTILAIVESLSIAKSIAGQSGDRFDANQELVGQGLANMAAAFTSGIPGTGSFTRSAVNFKSGAATRFAGAWSALIVLGVVLALSPWAKYIPIASLAGIIMVIAYAMVDQKAFALSWRANRSDRVVLVITMLSALFLDLEQAIYLGVLLSVILFLRKVSTPQVEKVAPREVGGKFLPLEAKSPALICPQIGIYQIRGSIFFGAASELEEQMRAIHDSGVKILLVRMDFVRIIDATGVHAFQNLLAEMKRRGIKVILCGVQPGVGRVLARTGIASQIGGQNITARTPEGVALAYQYADKAICKNCPVRAFRECEE